MTVLEVLGITLLVLLFIWETWYRIQVRRRTRPFSLVGKENGHAAYHGSASGSIRVMTLREAALFYPKPRRRWYEGIMELCASVRHRISATFSGLTAPLIEAYDRSRDRRAYAEQPRPELRHVWWSNVVMACVPFQLQVLWANYDRRSE
jgi:hypothetical protein